MTAIKNKLNIAPFMGLLILLIGLINSSPTLNILSPTNGSMFGQQCYLPVEVNVNFSNGTDTRIISCELFFSGVANNITYLNKFKDIKYSEAPNSGNYILNFSSISANGNFSLNCTAQDSSGSAYATGWAQFFDMTTCHAQNYKKTGSGITTKLYSQFEIEHFDISYIVGILILGLALFGMVNYVQKLRKVQTLFRRKNY